MGRRKFDRTVVKKCPICGQQIPVACRYCSCGHQFTTRVRSSSSTSSIPDERDGNQGIASDGSEGKQRRTVRTKRVRPDFFNSLDLEYTTRQIKHKKAKELLNIKKKRGRPKGSVNRPKIHETTAATTTSTSETTITAKTAATTPTTPTEPQAPGRPPVEEDVFAAVSQERLNTYNIILLELNRKTFLTQTFNPV